MLPFLQAPRGHWVLQEAWKAGHGCTQASPRPTNADADTGTVFLCHTSPAPPPRELQGKEVTPGPTLELAAGSRHTGTWGCSVLAPTFLHGRHWGPPAPWHPSPQPPASTFPNGNVTKDTPFHVRSPLTAIFYFLVSAFPSSMPDFSALYLAHPQVSDFQGSHINNKPV